MSTLLEVDGSRFGLLVYFLDLPVGRFFGVLGFFCACWVLWKGYSFARLGLFYDMLIPLLVDHFIVMIRSSMSYRASALVRDILRLNVLGSFLYCVC